MFKKTNFIFQELPLYFNNHAPYGNNLASYPVDLKVVPINGTQGNDLVLNSGTPFSLDLYLIDN